MLTLTLCEEKITVHCYGPEAVYFRHPGMLQTGRPPLPILSQVWTNYLRGDSGWKIIELNSASLTFLV